jgi:hypothetical protein
LTYAFDTSGLVIKNVKHERHIPILNQGQIGSCTGNAGIGAISTSPIYEVLPINKKYSLDEKGALGLYSDAEKIDGGVGYPPEDNGSSGLSICKALKNAGLISGYQHTFTLQDALKAGSQYPFIAGMNWYNTMFEPDIDGRVHPIGTIEGGHEVEMNEIDADNGRLWFCNSWGTKWGVGGRFYLTWLDFNTLLKQQGDVTIPFPDTMPIPIPSITIKRDLSDTKETTGSAVIKYGDTVQTCKSLELPWLNNLPNVSCIPAGTYDALWTFSPSMLKYIYELQNVPGRSGIRIHVANYYKELEGCIALGATLKDINGDGELDVTSSTITINAFNALMAKKPIKVIIS